MTKSASAPSTHACSHADAPAIPPSLRTSAIADLVRAPHAERCDRLEGEEATPSAESRNIVIGFDLDAHITEINEAARAFFLDEGEVGIGRHLSEFIVSSQCRAYFNTLSQAEEFDGTPSLVSVLPVMLRGRGAQRVPANLRIIESMRDGAFRLNAHMSLASHLN